MTNKMPVVGERYKNNFGAVFLIAERKEGTVVSGGGVLLESVDDGYNSWFFVRENDYSLFFKLFQELPEDKLHKIEKVIEVERALETKKTFNNKNGK